MLTRPNLGEGFNGYTIIILSMSALIPGLFLTVIPTCLWLSKIWDLCYIESCAPDVQTVAVTARTYLACLVIALDITGSSCALRRRVLSYSIPSQYRLFWSTWGLMCVPNFTKINSCLCIPGGSLLDTSWNHMKRVYIHPPPNVSAPF